MSWLTSLFTDPATAPAAWGLLALVALLVVVLAATRMRRARSGMFVAGGRKHRLAVLDATAIDNRRRLVLVRRDDVEHLILIGGHNDMVVETGIGAAGAKADKQRDAAPGARREPAGAGPADRPDEGSGAEVAAASAVSRPAGKPSAPEMTPAAEPRPTPRPDPAPPPAPPVAKPQPKPPERVEPTLSEPRGASPVGPAAVPPNRAPDVAPPLQARPQQPAPAVDHRPAAQTAAASAPPPDVAPDNRPQATGPQQAAAPDDTSLDVEMERLLDGLLDEPAKRDNN